MTKAELIKALEESKSDDDQEVIIWVEGCKRTISDVDDFEGLTLSFDIAKT